MSAETMRRDLAALQPILHIRQLVFVGGEPLMHPRIVELLQVAREANICEDVLTITNGVLVKKMPEAFWAAKPTLWISRYPVLPQANVDFAEAKSKEHGFWLGIRQSDRFYKQFKATPDDGRETFRNCPWKSTCFTVHEGRFYLCPQSCFFPSQLMKLPDGLAGLPLEGITREKLQAFMDRTEPFDACRICLGMGPEMDWHQNDNMEEWIKDATV